MNTEEWWSSPVKNHYKSMFYIALFVIMFLGIHLWAEMKQNPEYYMNRNKYVKVVKEIVEVDNGWHLPDLTSKGYVAEIRYKRL